MNEVSSSHTEIALPVHRLATCTGISGDGVGDQFGHYSSALVGRAGFGHGGTAMTDASALTGQILLYRSEDGRTRLDVRLESGSTSPASTVRKPRGKKNVGS